MIKEILERCSEAELGNILGVDTLKLAKEITNNEIDLRHLSNAVFLTLGIDLIKSEEYRNLIISKMSEKQLIDVYNKFNNEIDLSSLNTQQRYDVLKTLSNKYTYQFATIMGMKEQWDVADLASIPTSDVQVICPGYPLYNYQEEIVNKTLTLVNNEKGTNRALMHLPTGAGKTRTALNVVCEHLRNNKNTLVVWLADSEELCEQASSEFNVAWKNLGNREISSYSFFSDSSKSLSGIKSGFLVAGLHRINALKKTERSFLFDKIQERVTLVIFDEAHKAIANTYSEIVNELVNTSNKRTFLLGLTATPGRSFGDDRSQNDELSSFFSQTKITMKVSGYSSPVNYLVENEYLARANFFPLNYESPVVFEEGEFVANESSVLSKLANIDDRNSSIIKQVIQEYNKDKTIIIFACSVSNSKELAATLCCLGYPASSLDSKNDTTESRRAKISDFKSGRLRIIVNYGVLTTGFDAPKTNVAIIGRPTKSLVLYSQMVGRAMRGKRSGGNSECNIYTVIDDIPEFNSVSNAFEYWDKSWAEV